MHTQALKYLNEERMLNIAMSEAISSSIGFPLWIAYSFELIGTVGMTIYTYVNTIKYALKVVKG